jgi:histidinol-phosphatase (PHP family)
MYKSDACQRLFCPSQLIRKYNGRLALSDDSHGPRAVALNYDGLYSYLRRMGVDELWYIQESEQPNVGGRFVKAVKMDGSWWEHPFWGSIVEQK